MKNRHICIALLALAAAPLFPGGPAWRRDAGLRAGGTWAIVPFSASVFYEARSDRNWALRPALEVTKGMEVGISGDLAYGMDIGRVGAAMDLVYYTSSKKPIGAGFFLTAGLGLHRFDILDDNQAWDSALGHWVRPGARDTQTAASYSLGAGYYFGRAFGVEAKYSVSDQDSKVADGVGRNWLQLGVNFRFPTPGQGGAEHPRDAAYRADKAAKRARADALPLWKHKIGVSAGSAMPFAVATDETDSVSVFYENRLGGRWALRPAVAFMWGVGVSKGYSVDVDRAGLSVDCVYYASGRGRNGAGFYLLAGLGAHRVAMKDESGAWNDDGTRHRREHSSVAPALSVGLGHYFRRHIGVEYRHTFSTPNSTFPGGVGRDWGQLALNLRLPAPGAPKGGR